MTSSGLFSGYHGAREMPPASIIVCEEEFKNKGQAVTITCPLPTFLNLTYMNYGRTKPVWEVCFSRVGLPTKTCVPEASLTEQGKALCQGRQTCELSYSGLGLWDTCHDTYKYFDVRYACIDQGEKNDTLAGYEDTTYHQIFNITRNKSPNFNVSRIVL